VPEAQGRIKAAATATATTKERGAVAGLFTTTKDTVAKHLRQKNQFVILLSPPPLPHCPAAAIFFFLPAAVLVVPCPSSSL
jgi:hypothetical protein